MTPEFAKAVDPVLMRVLDLLERIERGEGTSVQDEREAIRGLLDQGDRMLSHRSEDWKLAKYALVCWIDDMLLKTPWEGRDYMNEHTFEQQDFGTRLANDEFYEKSQLATRMTHKDALEVFYICVILGFRGFYGNPEEAAIFAAPRGLPPDIETWAKQTAMSIQVGKWRPPIRETGKPGRGAPPLEGQSQWIGAMAAGLILLLMAATLAFAILNVDRTKSPDRNNGAAHRSQGIPAA